MTEISILGHYQLIEPIGQGGFASVYRARETALDIFRAVKVLHPTLTADPQFIERFRREARTAARLEHPNIVPVYELGEAEGRYYLAMKFMPGGSLKDLIARQGQLEYTRSVEIARQVASALDFAHAQGMVHRDVKPGNILFESDGTARLADFGFVKALQGTSSTTLSASGGMVGTPQYMAPEVWRGKPASPATDVYSLACVFYEMITGEVLFAGESPPEIMTRHVLDGPQLPEEWPEGVPEGVAAVLEKALSREQEERYINSGGFCRALDSLLVKPRELTPPAEPDWHFAEQNAPSPDKTISEPFLQLEEKRKWTNQISKKHVGAFLGIFLITVFMLVMFSIAFSDRNALVIPHEITQIVYYTSTPQYAKINTTRTINAIIKMTLEQSTYTPTITLTPQATNTTNQQTRNVINARAKITEYYMLKTDAARGTERKKLTEFAEIQPTREFLISKLLANGIQNNPEYLTSFSGTLRHEQDGQLEIKNADLTIKNFILTATFTNPHTKSWSYGFGFRDNGANKEMRLYVNSDRKWRLWDSNKQLIQEGKLANFNSQDHGMNSLTLICVNKSGWLYMLV